MTSSADAFERLSRANPVPAADDPALVARARELAREWETVPVATSFPASRRRLQLAVAVVLALGVLLVVAPALGFRLPAIDFWSSDEAPPKIVRDFETLNVGEPPGMAVDVIPGETRMLTLTDPSGKRHTLYLAPTRRGGFCSRSARGGGCDKLGTTPLSVSFDFARSGVGVPLAGVAPPTAIEGYVNSNYADSVEIEFADGQKIELAVTWISEPIGAGFFVYQVPDDRRVAARRLESVTARNSDGDVVAQQVVDRTAIREAPAEALLEDKRAVFRTATSSGPATYWMAPTRYEGRCAWLDVAGQSGLFSRCLPKGYETSPGVGFGFVPLEDDVLVAGEFDPRFRYVDIVYSDGTVERAEPRAGLLLHRIAAERFARGEAVTALVGRRTDMSEIVRFPVPTEFGSGDPCLLPRPLGERRSAVCRSR
jgi:hypothetical protein